MSNEELNELKKEVASVNEKLQELTDEELEQVTGGLVIAICKKRSTLLDD